MWCFIKGWNLTISKLHKLQKSFLHQMFYTVSLWQSPFKQNQFKSVFLVFSFIITLIDLSFMICLSGNCFHLINILNKSTKEFPSKLGKVVNTNSTLPEAHLAHILNPFSHISLIYSTTTNSPHPWDNHETKKNTFLSKCLQKML